MFVKKAWSFWRQLQVLSCRPEAEVPAQVFSIFVLDCDPRCFCSDCSYHYPVGEIHLLILHTSPLCWCFIFNRWERYIFLYYIPTMLIVITSWTFFLLPSTSYPSRLPTVDNGNLLQSPLAIIIITIIININGNHHDCLQNCSPCHRLLAPHQHLLRHRISKSKLPSKLAMMYNGD